jgi:hypothetical protein
MLSVTIKPFMLSVVMLNVIMLSVTNPIMFVSYIFQHTVQLIYLFSCIGV